MIAVDPGGTTGFAYWSNWQGREEFEAWDVEGFIPAIECARDWLASDPTALVCESFRLSKHTIEKTQGGSLLTIELIGALRYLAHETGVKFITQTPAEAVTFVTSEKLRALGWWTKGSDHARSATKHLVLYLVANQLIDPRRVLT